MNRVNILVLLTMLSGCMATTTTLTSTGEPLRADVRSNAERFADNGTVYEPGQYFWLEGLYQGETKIEDEIDFYKAAGNQERVDGIIEWRKRHNFGIMASWVGFGVAAAAFGGAFGYFAYRTDGFSEARLEPFFTSTEGQATMGAITAGGILLGAAPFAYMFLGPKQTIIIERPPEGSWTYELVYSRDVAATVVEQYNANLGPPAE